MPRNLSPFPDFCDLNEFYTPEQKAIVQTVRQFVAKELAPKVVQAYRSEEFPTEFFPMMGDLGLLGANLTGYGLPGLDNLSYCLMMKELERCDSGIRSAASVQGSLVMYPLWAFGSEEQKKTWLPHLGSGKAIGCFGLTESEGGSDPGAMRTRVEDKGDYFLLNGSKMWITNGSFADLAIVLAQTGQGIRGFVVPTISEGFKAVKMSHKLSLRASMTSELYFENIKLPKSAILPKSEGLKSALQCLNQARFGIAWGAIGAAEACFDETLKFAKERVIFGKKLAGFQLAQRKFALMYSKLTQAQLLVFRLAQLKEQGTLHHSQVSMAKQVCVEMALEVARTCRDVLGANGIMDEYQTMRHLCNLESVYTYEGTNDIHLLVLGQELTGIAAFS